MKRALLEPAGEGLWEARIGKLLCRSSALSLPCSRRRDVEELQLEKLLEKGGVNRQVSRLQSSVDALMVVSGCL